MKLLIDIVSRGSGGAKRHLKEILKYSNEDFCHFDLIYIWGPSSFLNILPENKKIIKKSHFLLNFGIFGFFIFNLFFKKNIFKKNYDIIFSPFGNFTSDIHPYVSMSRNMLMFDKIERNRFKVGLTRLKLKYLYLINKKSFEKSDGIIFLSKYAQKVVNSQLKIFNIKQTIINHGVSDKFIKKNRSTINFNKPFKLLYVSDIFPYKHHSKLIKAVIELVKTEGYDIELTLVGKNAHNSTFKNIRRLIFDKKNNEFIKWKNNIGLEAVIDFYHKSDCFIFCSSCENMPNILIEAMSSGLPVISSKYPPMPEFIQNACLYMDPLSVNDIKKSIKKVINNQKFAVNISEKSFKLSQKYSWKKCAKETYSFLFEISSSYHNSNFKNIQS